MKSNVTIKNLAMRMQDLQAMHLAKALYLKYIKSSQNSIVNNQVIKQEKDMNKYFTKKEN